MLVSTQHRKLLLRLRNPAPVARSIPNSKTVRLKGVDFLAVDHSIDATRVLRNLGVKAPSPINHYYTWSGQYTPFEAQRQTAAFLTLNPRAFCLNEMGTGKSISTLWAFDYLRKIGVVKKLLVVAPLSTLERTWADEVFRHFMHLKCVVLHGTRKRRLKMLATDADVYLINHDGVNVIKKELADSDIDVVAIDEIASFRNGTTTRFKSMKAITENRTWVWGLTGTPTPNAPTDAWAQCRLIVPENVPKFFTAFRDMTMRRQTQFKWEAKDDATDTVRRAMSPAIRFSRDSCVDIPECMYVTRTVEMEPEHKAAYKDMLTKLTLEVQDQTVSAVNEAVKLGKLIQIAAGVVYDTQGKETFLGAPNKLAELDDILEQADAKVIVFVTHRSAINYVTNHLEQKYRVGVIHGGVSKNARDKIFHQFQSGKSMRVLVAQPASMSHGLTLTASNTIVWFSPPSGTETYIQANARITRPGQKQRQFIINLESCSVERKAFQRMKNRQSMQGALLDIIAGVN